MLKKVNSAQMSTCQHFHICRVFLPPKKHNRWADRHAADLVFQDSVLLPRAFYFGAKSNRWFLLPPPKLLPDSDHSTMSVVRWKAAPSCASIFAGACVSYSESARQKQLSVTFLTRSCRQSCTQRVRFHKDSCESTHSVFFGALAQHPKMKFSQTTASVTANPLDKNSRP